MRPTEIKPEITIEDLDKVDIRAGTILEANGYIVVCKDPAAVEAEYGITNVVGPYTGFLDGSGERVTLVSHVGIREQSLRYRVKGKWPTAPDGTGHTLAIRNVHFDSSEPESWSSARRSAMAPS